MATRKAGLEAPLDAPEPYRLVTVLPEASRTMLIDLETGEWDIRMLDIFDIPAAMLPRVVESCAFAGRIGISVPKWAEEIVQGCARAGGSFIEREDERHAELLSRCRPYN